MKIWVKTVLLSILLLLLLELRAEANPKKRKKSRRPGSGGSSSGGGGGKSEGVGDDSTGLSHPRTYTTAGDTNFQSRGWGDFDSHIGWNFHNSNIGSSKNIDIFSPNYSLNGNTRSRNNEDWYRVPHKKSKGDWTWLKEAAAAHEVTGARPRIKGLSVPVFYRYHRRPGWRGAVGDFFDSSFEEDGRTVVVMGRQENRNKTSCIGKSCSSKEYCQVLCTPMACRGIDGEPCMFTCLATSCTKSGIILKALSNLKFCDGVFQIFGSCNPRQFSWHCNGFDRSCNFTCTAVPCSATGGFCNFTCPSVPCDTGPSSSCTSLQLNVTNVLENSASSNFTCQVRSCNYGERSCSHSCTFISNNSTVTSQPTEASVKATDLILTTTGVPSSDVKLFRQDLTSNNTTPRSIEDNVAEFT